MMELQPLSSGHGEFGVVQNGIRIATIVRPLYRKDYQFCPSTSKLYWTQAELAEINEKLNQLNQSKT